MHCNFFCTRADNLKKHIITHTRENHLRCEQCSYSCIQPRSLKEHCTCSPIREKNLPVASSANTQVQELVTSKNTCSNIQERSLSGVNSVAIIALKSLNRHMLTHSGEKPFACIECNNTFTTTGNLKQHIMLHSGENPFRCEQCDYSCAQAQHLKEHMMRHSGAKLCSKALV